MAPGASLFSLGPAAGGTVLHDTFLSPDSVPAFSPASVTVTVLAPSLFISRTGPNQATINWTKGKLETTEALGASWVPVTTLTNSLVIALTGPQRFYRTVIP